MSSNLPPSDDQSGQPTPAQQFGGFSGPPLGRPSGDGADYLVGGSPEAPRPRSRARRIALVGLGVTMLAAVGGGVWAWNFWVDQGPQPAEALPASTLAYVAVDLDPSGQQKVAAMRTLEKFPMFEEELGFDLDSDDDLKKWLFESLQDEEDLCVDLDYGDDIEGWIGDRFAFAMVERADGGPAPVVVAQVTDQDAAEDGIKALLDCANTDDAISSTESGFRYVEGSPEALAGYAFNGDWVVLAEDEELALEVVAGAEDKPLSADSDYQRWTEAVGDPGFINAYAAPEAGDALMEFMDDAMADAMADVDSGCAEDEFPEPPENASKDRLDAYEDYLAYCAELEGGPESMLPDGYRQFFEDFSGMAATLRFDDGDVELEFATAETELSNSAFLADGGPAILSTLPDTTAAAFGAGFGDDWLEGLLDQWDLLFGSELGGSEDMLEMLEEQTGITREDLEALDGASVAIAIDSGLDPAAFEDEDITRIPVGAKIEGDTEAIEALLAKIKAAAGDDLSPLVWETEGDYVLVSADPEYLTVLAEEDGLGGEDAFDDLAPDADDARGVFFVNVDADDWLDDLLVELGAPDEVRDNVEPLQGLGLTIWVEDEEEHTLLRLTTE